MNKLSIVFKSQKFSLLYDFEQFQWKKLKVCILLDVSQVYINFLAYSTSKMIRKV